MSRPDLVVISGPSGSGKTTLIKGLLSDPSLRRAVTATTRAPRKGEADGVAYHFKSKAEFAALRDEGALLEWAEVHGEWYGTPRSEIEKRPGKTTLLDVDVQGFRSVRAQCAAFMSIFVAPPSLDELRARLVARGTETNEQIERRLSRVRDEMSAQGEYDHVLINHDVAKSQEELRRLIQNAAGPVSGTGNPR